MKKQALTSASSHQPTRQELIALRQEIAQASSTKKLELILASPRPKALVQSMHPQELLMTMKDIGIEDCAEIIPLAKKRQLTFAVDVDCWSKDQFQGEHLLPWLRFLPVQELAPAESVLAAMDSELLVLFFRDLVRIYERQEEDPPPVVEGELIEMTDKMYFVEIIFPPEDPRNILAHSAIRLFEQYGFPFYHKLFESIRNGLPTELQEISYQFRKGRMEDYGFIDYYDAIQIYTPLPRDAQPYPISYAEDKIASLPQAYQARKESLFHRGYDRLPVEHQQRVNFELVYLANKVMSAEQIDLANNLAAKNTIQSTLHTIDIGIETLLQEDPTNFPANVLATQHLEYLFRKGFTVLATLRRPARLALESKKYTLVPKQQTLLTPPQVNFLQGLSKIKPMFVDGIKKQGKPTSARHFRSLFEVRKAERRLDAIQFLPSLFFEKLGLRHEELEEYEFHSPISKHMVKFSHLFLTLVANTVLFSEVSFQPIPENQLHPLLQMLFTTEEGKNRLKADIQQQVEDALFAYPFTQEEQAQAREFLEESWKHLLDEAALLDLEASLSPKFLDLFLIGKAKGNDC